MNSPLEPLSDDLERLFAAERQAFGEDAAAKAAMLAKIELAASLTPPAIPSGGALGRALGSAGLSSKAIGLIAAGAFAVGMATGAGLVKATEAPAQPGLQPTLQYPTEPHPVAPRPMVPPPDVEPRTRDKGAETASPMPEDATKGTIVRPRAASSDLARERELLDVARAALATANTALALASVEQHAKTWPKGQMKEEREVLWIQALVAANRRDEATRHAGAFRRDFPDSILLPSVEAALGEPK